MGFLGLLFLYIFGGVTFLPLLLLCVFLYGYATFPDHGDHGHDAIQGSDDLRDKSDDTQNIKSGQQLAELEEKFHRTHEPDVASGYFAVCREYVPGGVNGKPPERTTPAGSTIVAESPSVYQSMYRSLFDRKGPSSLEPSNGNGKATKRARNVFFVVLRHGHLMLYESSEQNEVKYVISLELHDVSIHSGEEVIPEGELWIKRNAIKLSRKPLVAGEDSSMPFFFFSENLSDKEDFYFALLQNQEIVPGAADNPPRPLRYETTHIIGLVQRLHSSEEQLQTRWINALLGRLFLALYKTPQVEDFVRTKITKKIARVKKPAFLSNIILRKIDMGDSAPQVTNPKLKDFTIDGDCCVEGDFKYSGNFRLEIATTARIDLGSRFKAREVNLVLAIVVKKLNGHGLLKFKPPPCNRFWISFDSMPDMEMAIEPIVSSRQITYGFILRAIESRIREVLAETMVLPNWDDIPFTDTKKQTFRGGTWANSSPSSVPITKIPDEAAEDEVDMENDPAAAPSTPKTKDEGVLNIPALPKTPTTPTVDSARTPSSESNMDFIPEANTTGSQRTANPPKALRSRSFASAANPLLSMDTANFKDSIQTDKTKNKSLKDATSAMMAISSKSRPSSPPENTATLPSGTSSSSQSLRENGDRSSNTSLHSKADGDQASSPIAIEGPFNHHLRSSSATMSLPSSLTAPTGSLRSRASPLAKQSTVLSEKGQTAINAATTAAKNWGWGVLNRNSDQKPRPNLNPDRAGTPNHPIGRGQPLPPPGQPLPFPDGQKSKTAQAASSKRKSTSSMGSVQKSDHDKSRNNSISSLPTRRRQMSVPLDDPSTNGVLVVEAPPDSDPGSPDEQRKPTLDSSKAASSDENSLVEEKIDTKKAVLENPADSAIKEQSFQAPMEELPIDDTSMQAWDLESEPI